MLKKCQKTRAQFLICSFCLLGGRQALAQKSDDSALRLTEYLEQVRDKNLGYQGNESSKAGATGRAREADLLFRPSLFANAQYQNDSKLPTLPIPGFSYDRLETRNYSLGISEATSFGLQAKVYYAVDATKYVFPGQPAAFYDARPVIELSQALWQNGFGRADRANADVIRAQSDSDRWTSETQKQNLEVSAEAAYWRLVIARELVRIETTAHASAESIYNYNAKRTQMNLADQADALQSRASLEAKALDLKSATDEEESATINFNSFRNVASGERPNRLEEIDWDQFKAPLSAPAFAYRADTKAAEAQSRAAIAAAKLQSERDLPTLGVSAAYAINGRGGTLNPALDNSFSSGRSTFSAAIKFTLPLDFSAVTEARKAADLNAKGADLVYRQKVRDQESQWKTLVKSLENAKARLGLALTIVSAQKAKLDYERKRLRQGRTTTYQILLFEQDFTAAEYAKTNAAYQVLTYQSQLKLYKNGGETL